MAATCVCRLYHRLRLHSFNLSLRAFSGGQLDVRFSKRNTELKSSLLCESENLKIQENTKNRAKLQTIISILTKRQGINNKFIESYVRKLYDESPGELSGTLQNNIKIDFEKKQITGKAAKIINFKPQILGLTSDQLIRRLAFLDSFDVRGKDAIIISLSIPSTLSLESARFKEMVDILKSFDCDVVKHLFDNPWVFNLNPELCRDKLGVLEKAGLSRKDISFLVDAHPTLMSFGVDKSVLDTAEKSMSLLQSTMSNTTGEELCLKAKALHVSLTWPGYFCNVDNINLEVKQFLESLQIPVDDIFLKCPVFFQQTFYKLEDIKDFLTSEPVSLNLQDVCQLIKHRPEMYTQLLHPNAKMNVEYFAEIVSKEALMKILIHARQLLFKTSEVADFVQSMQNFGFTDLEIENILSDGTAEIDSLFKMKTDLLGQKLSCILGYQDFKPTDVASFPACLNIHSIHLENRLGYKRLKFPEMSYNISLKELLMCSDKNFVKRLGSKDISSYKKFMKKKDKTEKT